ncbi:MAG: hypothetical protein HWD59_15300 [Coxiellaceae bacterium]|nr:MAG: hypothetical protein HWD59_15300 [Coxiellaceae bacterium]
MQDIEKLYDENDVEAPLLLSSSIVVAFKNKSTAYLEHLILWNNKIDLEIKKIALEEIINRANGHILVQPAALSALANIVLYENSYQLNQYALSQKALNTIQEIATDQVRIKKLLGSTYANYLDWSLGYKSKWRHLFFMPFHLITSSAVWYTTGHYLEVFGIKVVNAIQLLINKYNCENQGKNFRYIDPFAEYVCSLCGDWPVYLGGIDTSQDCLYGLTNQSVPIETLTSRITDRLTGQYADYCEDFADSIWEVASQKYAASAKGDVYVFSNGANPERIYTKIELPILKSNLTLVALIIWIIPIWIVSMFLK